MKLFFVALLFFPHLAFSAIPAKLIFKDQLKIALNNQAPMSQRWIAVMNSFDVASENEMKELFQLFDHKDWYIRNASLLAIEKKDKLKAEQFAIKSIKDRALVVRSAAAEILIKLDNDGAMKTLKEEINQPYNFRGQQSLWIRGQMMGYLMTKSETLDRDFFVLALFDKDSQIAEMGMQALEKKTDYKIDEKDSRKKLSLWKDYVKDQKWL